MNVPMERAETYMSLDFRFSIIYQIVAIYVK